MDFDYTNMDINVFESSSVDMDMMDSLTFDNLNMARLNRTDIDRINETITGVIRLSEILNSSWFIGNLSDLMAPPKSLIIGDRIKTLVSIPLGILIIIANMIVIGFFIVTRKVRYPGYTFTLNLAISDLILGFVCIAKGFMTSTISRELCLFRLGLIATTVCASITSMMWIAVDRYIAVKHPLTYYKKMSRLKLILALCHIWTQSILLGFAPLMGWNRVGRSYLYCVLTHTVPPEYLGVLFLVGIFIPLIVIGTIYWIIFFVARRHIRILDNQDNDVRRMSQDLGYIDGDNFSDSSSTTSSSEQEAEAPPPRSAASANFNRRLSFVPVSTRTFRAFKTLTLVIGCFLLTWGPFAISCIVVMVCGRNCKRLGSIISHYLILLGMFNSFLNPLVYALGNKEFRRTVRKTLFVKCCNQRGQELRRSNNSVYTVDSTDTSSGA
ncbi:unnamed protein product [Owenia fusiformis]|uniref:Uncharacterized protein n=1 Tax=Owenia fusiformis TaxID=6347 RepID=A0A8J1UD16_OWEFU|nr:unnamed protein product [Owenia fusiformis]